MGLRPLEVTIDIDVASTIYSVQLGAGLVMIDTGCRRASGGRLWHERLREELDARGVRYYREEAMEYFQLCPGEPIASHARWPYNVGIFGAATQLYIYELDSVSTAIDQAPGLIGPEELARWQGNIYFTDDTVEVFGRRGRIALAASGHPCISLLGFPEAGAVEEVASRGPEAHDDDHDEEQQ